MNSRFVGEKVNQSRYHPVRFRIIAPELRETSLFLPVTHLHGMPTFDAQPTTLYVFEIDGEYLFSEYFDHTDLFEQLAEYYNEDAYRFKGGRSWYQVMWRLLLLW